ncbi:OLC1v1032107C1 [Oldenlandia corymbosa var. corymbosa]|uniref:Pectinesterase n=1 Tax=Oldenlandia corymbosa var. corymbosa TaxID=529605 RepID=A0AAV1CKF8_OLDCO|nr:OLC1v1032107C1 [Oldenlandia corymbosa var. corymbosa]
MDKLIFPTITFLCLLIFLAPTKVANAATSPSSICSQTPYPELCHSLTITPKSTLTTLDDETSSSFDIRDASLKFTLAQAQYVHNLISTIDTTSFDKLSKAAWADCLELYEDTITNLARCSSSKNNLNDVQTWLSASNANHETCKNGFIDFQLNSQLQSFPFFNTNFSKHLSNSLAINKASLTSSLSASQVSSNDQIKNRKLLSLDSGDGFPAWVTTGDRKLLQSSGGPKADITVSQDGSGDYKTISEALAASSKMRSSSSRVVIYVKGGTYKENVVVTNSMSNIMMVGDGMGSTVVTGSKNVQDGATTFSSATFAVMGDRFIAQDMTFENTAGPAKHQAVALRSGSDFSVFYRCGFKGYQDTLYAYSKRQFYRDCDISGTIDFIFGDAVVVFQGCNINLRQPMSNQINTVTAQGRSDPNENTGIIIHNSQISGSGVSVKSYLGRPWQKCSRTVIMRSGISGAIDAAGWFPWSGSFALSTLYYAEYANTGAGAGTGGRVKWGGYHVLTSPADALKFSVGNFLAGNSWIPSTGVPFTAGL